MKSLTGHSQTILLIALLIMGCTTEPDSEENNLLDRVFVVIKSFQSGVFVDISVATCGGISCGAGIPDCACDGDAIEQTYYLDNDGNGLGGNISNGFCSATIPEDWVLNSDDDDDTTSFCWILYALDILESDLVINNGNLAFSYNEVDYSIDVSLCEETMNVALTRIIQDTALGILYVWVDVGAGGDELSYSSPNELLFIQ